jgi:hypothetical protein
VAAEDDAKHQAILGKRIVKERKGCEGAVAGETIITLDAVKRKVGKHSTSLRYFIFTHCLEGYEKGRRKHLVFFINCSYSFAQLKVTYGNVKLATGTIRLTYFLLFCETTLTTLEIDTK